MGWDIFDDRNWMNNATFEVLNLSKYITKDFLVTSLFFDPNEIKAGHGYQFDMASPASILSLK